MNFLQRNAFTSLLILVLLTILMWVGQTGYQQVFKLTDYLPLHTFMETLSVVVSMLIFTVGWVVYTAERIKTTAILSCALLSVGLLDMAHLLSYAGMPDWVTASSAQKSIYFWLCARFVLALALLSAVFIRWQAFRFESSRWLVLAAALLLTLCVCWLGLFKADSLPAFFVEGEGLTSLKIQAEYLLSGMYLLTSVLFVLRSRQKKAIWMQDLAISSFIMALSEVFFTWYHSPYDINNLLGHVYKVIAYLYLFKAIFLHNVRYPIEQLQHRDKSLRESQKALQMTQYAVDRSGDYIFMFDASGQTLYANEEAAARFGFDRACLSDLTVYDIAGAETDWPHYWTTLQETPCLRFETQHKTQGGQPVPVEVSLTLINDQDHVFVCAIVRDISERLSIQNKINNLAYYDQITQLPNRVLIEDRVQQAIANAHRNGTKVAVMFLDLDHFKNINDSLGHQAGDYLLRQVSLRLLSKIRASDSVGRYGGDEFIFVLSELHAPYEVLEIVQKLLISIAKPFSWQETEFRVTASIGISVYPDDGQNFSQLVMHADAAMYHAKKLGRNNYQFFSSDMNARATQQLQMENTLLRAIERKQFVLHYQPQFDIKTGACVALEALIRWYDPERGELLPVEFIPLAEERGLIVALGDWVIDEACRQNVAWLKAGLPICPVWVNMSATQVHRADMIDKLSASLTKHQLDAKYLAVEVTESAIMQDAERCIGSLNALKDLGIALAIDDFGTGYSSLSYLKRFPLDKIKIDRSFIRDISDDSDDLILTQAIVALATQMKLTVIAEGVETAAQYDILKRIGCHEFQGYLASKPLAAEDIEKVLGQPEFMSAALA